MANASETVEFEPVPLVMRFPKASVTSTVTEGLIDTTETALLGCWTNDNLEAPAGMILKAFETIPDPTPLKRNLYPLPTLFKVRLLKVATPATAALGVVPDKVELPGLNPVSMAAEIEVVSPVRRFPNWSSILTNIPLVEFRFVPAAKSAFEFICVEIES